MGALSGIIFCPMMYNVLFNMLCNVLCIVMCSNIGHIIIVTRCIEESMLCSYVRGAYCLKEE